MPHPLLSEALKEAYASASTEVDVIETLQLTDETENDIFICSGNIPQPLMLSPGVYRTFQPYPFKVSKDVGISDTGTATITVSVENVNGLVSDFLRKTRAADRTVYVLMRTYIDGVDGPQNSRPIKLELTGADITLSGVTLTASTPDVVNKAFPNAYYSYTSYPGLRG